MVRKNTVPSKNGIVKLIQLHMYQGGAIFKVKIILKCIFPKVGFFKFKFYLLIHYKSQCDEINCVGISKAFSIGCNSLIFKNESYKLGIKYLKKNSKHWFILFYYLIKLDKISTFGYYIPYCIHLGVEWPFFILLGWQDREEKALGLGVPKHTFTRLG